MPSLGLGVLLLSAVLDLAVAISAEGGRRSLTDDRCKGPACLKLPAQSSLAEWKEQGWGPDYYDFANVKLVGESLTFFQHAEAVPVVGEAEPPSAIPLNKDEANLDLIIKQVAYTGDAQCQQVHEDPAILLAGTPWDKNFYEMLVNNVMPLWATAKEEGLLVGSRYLSTSQPPESSSASFVLIQARQEGYDNPWSYLFNYMTPKQLLLKEVDGDCFSRLIVISDSILRFVITRGFPSEAHKLQFETKQQRLFQGFQRWMFLVESLHQRSLGIPKPQKPTDSASYSRPRVVFSSRPVRSDGGFQSRGLENEPEVVRLIEEQYDVNVTVVNFGSTLEPIMQLLQSSSLFVGMHGAGLTHAMWLKPGSHFLQLAPYGYSPDGQSLIRGDYYRDIALTAGCTASHWVNPHAHKAFFHKEHFFEEGEENFFQHPNETTPKPTDWNAPYYWVYQSTEVDLESFGQKLHHAMSLLNIPQRHLV